MNKIKQVITIVATISSMSMVGLSMAATCPTTLSQSTATCLSNAADATFQSNYTTEYAQQKSGSSSSNNNNTNVNTNHNTNNNTNVNSNQKTTSNNNNNTTPNPPTSSNSTNNNDNENNSSSIHWF